MLKIIDNAIPDDVRRDLLYDKQYTAFPRQQYEWWDLKYFDFPRTAIHQALHCIWKDHIDFEEFKDGGIEWWISKDNVVNGESPYPTHIWHSDIHEVKGKSITPESFKSGSMGNVYYPHSNCLGGFFEVLDNEPFETWPDVEKFIRCIDQSVDVERIKSRTNRSIFFNPYRVHRVSRIYNGTRESMASTLWKKKPVDF